MSAFNILAKVDQIVTKEVMLLIEAETAEDAKEKAKSVLSEYPGPLPYDPMVHRVVTRNSKYWIPKSVEFVTVEEENDAA